MARNRKNKDTYRIDETLDLTPKRVQSAFQRANSGYVKQQSRIANELTEKDLAISQAWAVRVAAISACPWEVVGNNADFINDTLRNIQPQYDSGLVSFNKQLEAMQSAVLHGFQLSQTDWINGGAGINGFKVYDQSLFCFHDSDLPYYQAPYVEGMTENERKFKPKYPRWIYHTASNARQTEPLRTGIVRPLAYAYSFRRHVLIPLLRGIEKYGLPFVAANVDQFLYESTEQKTDLENMLADMTYDGWGIFPKDKVDLTFPFDSSKFDHWVFLDYLNYTEKQIFRLILGQDSTMSADNSNRSTAQVHNSVRADILEMDAYNIAQTVNDQIIKPLSVANFGEGAEKPIFRFITKGIDELNKFATFIKTMAEAGWALEPQDIEQRTGLRFSRIEETENNDS